MKSKIYMEIKYKIYMAEELWAFGEANSTLVLDLGCIQICLSYMCRFFCFFPPKFFSGAFCCLLTLSEYRQFVHFPAYLHNRGTAPAKIFYLLSCP